MVEGGRHIRPVAPAHRPSEAEITVTIGRRGRGRGGGALVAGGAIIATAALLGVFIAVTSSAARHNPSATLGTTPTTQEDGAGAAGIAAAYGYPSRCLRVTISASDPNAATARVNRAGPCARYRGYVDASFHRIDGGWRLVLDEGQLFVPNNLLAPGR
ncbi:MAG: hypothetical protein JOZ98_13615 [Solirubrobacterales bacterium]|nr:hypothetical protein [Solirubrobacterales bacterium]